MIWKPLDIPRINSQTEQWDIVHIETLKEWIDMLNSQFKLPGEYGLNNTHLWRPNALKFQKDKRFCDYDENSDEYQNYFKREKIKIARGIFVDEFYIPGAYYDYLNFSPIVDKVKGREDFPDLWDSDYHWYLYVERSIAVNKNAGTVKARQKGVSIKETRRLFRNFWFIPMSVNKMLAYEDDFINEKGSWKFMVGYRNFMNENTPWYRDCEPDEAQNWEQKKTITEGVYETKKRFVGLRSKLIALTTKKNVAKAVGGHLTRLYAEESGIAPNLDKVLEFAESAMKMGGITTGHAVIAGAVGDLKDCKPLEEIAFSPEENGFLGVEDVFSDPENKASKPILFFWPDYWNYIANDPEKGLVKCFDEHGNSDIELAKYYLTEEDKRQQKKANYILWKSQHPWTLQDAFNVREDNIWPTKIIKEHQILLKQEYESLTVELKESDNVIYHEISYNKPISSLKVDPTKDNRGVIEIDEMPIDNPPYGLYYAGVDPIRAVNTVTSKSLMSVVIMKASHYKDGKMVSDYPVARYTGRYPTWEETYEVCLRLCRFYNARIAEENNVTAFHEWAIKNNYGHLFMHRREIHIINELMPNSTIRDEIGIRMEGEFKKKALEFGVGYVDEVISSYQVADKDNPDQSITKYIYGVTKLRDPMLCEEMLKFRADLNTDRIIAFLCALMAARSNTNRNMIVSEKSDKRIVATKPVTLPSQFIQQKRKGQTNKLPPRFGKKLR